VNQTIAATTNRTVAMPRQTRPTRRAVTLLAERRPDRLVDVGDELAAQADELLVDEA
jgi:hypothetical protein